MIEQFTAMSPSNCAPKNRELASRLIFANVPKSSSYIGGQCLVTGEIPNIRPSGGGVPAYKSAGPYGPYWNPDASPVNEGWLYNSGLAGVNYFNYMGGASSIRAITFESLFYTGAGNSGNALLVAGPFSLSMISDTLFRFTLYTSGSYAYREFTPTQGKWYMVHGVYRGTGQTVEMYVNGARITSGLDGSGTNGATGNIIGYLTADQWDEGWLGGSSLGAVYKYGMSRADILQRVADPFGLFYRPVTPLTYDVRGQRKWIER